MFLRYFRSQHFDSHRQEVVTSAEGGITFAVRPSEYAEGLFEVAWHVEDTKFCKNAGRERSELRMLLGKVLILNLKDRGLIEIVKAVRTQAEVFERPSASLRDREIAAFDVEVKTLVPAIDKILQTRTLAERMMVDSKDAISALHLKESYEDKSR